MRKTGSEFLRVLFLISLSLNWNLIYAEDLSYQLTVRNLEYFKFALDRDTALPFDHVIVKDGEFKYGKYVSPTVIGLWAVLLTNIVKGDLEAPQFSKEEAKELLRKLLSTLLRLPKWKGLFFWYELKGGILPTEDGLISTYDNANLSLSLALIYGALSDSADLLERKMAEDAFNLLSSQKEGWRALYDPKRGLLWGGMRGGRPLTKLWIDRFYTEARLAPLIGILLADIPESAWFNMRRIVGKYSLSDGSRVLFLKPYQGAFHAWFPLLFVPEMELSKQLAQLHKNYALIQLDYLKRGKVPLLRSACADPNVGGRYLYEPAVGIIGASEDWVRSDIGCPYATALLYPIFPEKSLSLLQLAIERYPQLLGPLGLYDSLSEDGNVSNVYIALDQLQFILSFLTKANHTYFMNFVKKIAKEEKLKHLYEALPLLR